MANSSTNPAYHISQDEHALHPTVHHARSFDSLPPLADSNNARMPPEKHPKGKRKRTAAKDKMILEEAYCNNPKPDKQARLEIVQRVSLSEKEVQIWFQNRRQNDRRKSRPLSAHELASLHFGSMPPITSDSLVTPRKHETHFLASDPAGPRAPDLRTASPHPLNQTPAMPRPHPDVLAGTPVSLSQAGILRPFPDVTPKHDNLTSSQESHDATRPVGYLANRWNNIGNSATSTPPTGRGGDDSFKFESFPQSCDPSPQSSQSQSKVRLSLSLEGKAELVSNQITPTRDPPPRPSSTIPTLPQVRQRSLQRSQSALPSITLPPISALTNTLPPRLRGRSRDVQAWSSCADAEKRDELTAQAEHESNGSAIAAISLLRSSSGLLQPSGTKRNAPASKHQRPQQAKKARLDRSGSSTDRPGTEFEEATIEKPEKEYNKVKVSMLVSPSGDSDKENWSPDEDGASAHHRRPLPPTLPRPTQLNPRRLGRVLQDKGSSNFLANRANTAPTQSRALAKEGVEIFEDVVKKPAGPREDDVEKFMRGGELSPSKRPDIDCAAGLLSLSRSGWR